MELKFVLLTDAEDDSRQLESFGGDSWIAARLGKGGTWLYDTNNDPMGPFKETPSEIMALLNA